jgi:peptidoglycan/LPS O-acetylase OafA/YrhL
MRFSVLDALRGICALLVVLFHIEVIGAIHAGNLHQYSFLRHGFLFVDFFFVLSGFVISHAYLNKIETQKNIFKFMLRRFGRVYPLHLLILFAFIALELLKLFMVSHGHTHADNPPFSKNYSVNSIATNLFLLQAFGIHDAPTWNTPSWSISAEFYTYLVFALLILLVRKSPKMLTVVSIIAILMSLAILYLYSPHYIDNINALAIFRCFYGFFCGVIAQFLYQFLSSRYSPHTLIDSFLEIFVSIGVIFFVSYVGPEPLSLFAPILFLMVVLVFSRQGGVLSRLLMQKPFQYLGNTSYTMYILHAFIILLCAKFIRALMDKKLFGITQVQSPGQYEGTVNLIFLGSNFRQDIVVLSIVLGVFLAAYILHRFVEKPSQNYFNSLANSKYPE